MLFDSTAFVPLKKLGKSLLVVAVDSDIMFIVQLAIPARLLVYWPKSLPLGIEIFVEANRDDSISPMMTKIQVSVRKQ